MGTCVWIFWSYRTVIKKRNFVCDVYSCQKLLEILRLAGSVVVTFRFFSVLVCVCMCHCYCYIVFSRLFLHLSISTKRIPPIQPGEPESRRRVCRVPQDIAQGAGIGGVQTGAWVHRAYPAQHGHPCRRALRDGAGFLPELEWQDGYTGCVQR